MAEEEFAQQQETMLETYAENERRVVYYRMLFDYSPIASVVTDLNAGIREVNSAMCKLVRRDERALYRKPLAALVSRDDRHSFRTGLARLEITQGATNWMFSLERHGDLPVEVSAAVTRVPDRSIGSGALLWQLQARVDASVP